jgi:acrylyl-CoA reductase (NADPH)
MSDKFRALVLDETDGKVSPSFKNLTASDLPDGEVTVAVEYSTLNYKDGMIINGIGRLVRNYPHVPGVDFAGTVESSNSDRYKPGDKVVLTGWRVGEMHWGGYSAKARVKAGWLCPLPKGLSAKQAMAVGTAGFTSMLAVQALEDHGLTPDAEGEVLVTGAAGGLGSVAVAILAKLGYRVAAATGRESTHDWLRELGATEIVRREELSEPQKRPLLGERWAGCVDAVGGTTLVNALAAMRYGSSVAACGLAGGNDLGGTVLPFLLRGVNLLGIDSVMQPYDNRVRAWNRIVEALPVEKLEAITHVAKLDDLPKLASDILKGQVQGRMVIDVAGS